MSFQSFNLHSKLLQVLKKNLFSVFLAADDRDESEISFGERGPWKRGAGRGFTAELTLLHGSGSDCSSTTQQDGSCLTSGNCKNSTGIWQRLGAKQHASEEGEEDSNASLHHSAVAVSRKIQPHGPQVPATCDDCPSLFQR